jgi:hypothetical protein
MTKTSIERIENMTIKTVVKKINTMNILSFWFTDNETESPIYYYTIDVKTISVDTYQKENVYKINKVDFVSGEYEHMETLREFRTNNHSIKPMIDKIIERYKNIEIQIDSEADELEKEYIQQENELAKMYALNDIERDTQ